MVHISFYDIEVNSDKNLWLKKTKGMMDVPMESKEVDPLPLGEPTHIDDTEMSSQLSELLHAKSKYSFTTFDELKELLTAIEEVPKSELPLEVQRISAMRSVIGELDLLIGQEKLKQSLVEIIAFCAQKYHSGDLFNLLIYAKSGLGKSTLVKIIADVFYYCNLLPHTTFNTKERFLRGTRTSLVGGFLGSTAIKTEEFIKRCIKEGKVMLLDELSQFGSHQGRDSFAKEALDTINQAMTEYPSQLRVIAAGYEKDIKEYILPMNPGFERRFCFPLRMEEYTPAELRLIFLQMITQECWDVDNLTHVATVEWFRKNKKHFTFYGGSMEILSKLARMKAASRCFGLPSFLKKISQRDLEAAMESYKVLQHQIPSSLDSEACQSMYL